MVLIVKKKSMYLTLTVSRLRPHEYKNFNKTAYVTQW